MGESDHTRSDYIMREYLRLDEGGITPEIFHERLQDFLYDMGADSGPSLMALNYIELQKEILSGKMRTAFLLAFSEILFPVNTEENLDRKSLGKLRGATTFFGWIQEALHFYGKYSGRINSKIIENDFEFQLYKMMEWSPQTPVRAAASDYNIDILQGKQSEARLEWNNNIETSRLPYIPTKGREMDMISLLFEALSFTSHIKTQREYTGQGITERIKSVVGDYWGSIIADNEMFSIIGTSQEQDSGVFRDHEADIATTLNYIGDFNDRKAINVKIAEKLLSTTSMSEFKSPIDLNLFYTITVLINKEFESTIQFDHNDVFDLFSNSDFEGKFWAGVKSVYGTEKFNGIFGNDNNMFLSFYNVMKNLFSDSTNFNRMIQKVQGLNKYRLVWENEVASYLLAQDSQGNAIPLSEEILPDDIKTLGTNNEWIPLPSGYTFNEVHLIISGDNSEVGVLPLSRVIGLNGKIPQGVYIGCLGKASVVICDPNGNLLNGIVSLDASTRQFVLEENWYQDQVANNIIDPSDITDPNGVFTLENAYRALFLSTGNHISIMFQKQVVNFVPIEPFKPLFPSTTIQHSSMEILRTSKPYEFNPDRLNDPILKEQTDALINFLYQYTGDFRLTNIETGIPKIYVGNTFFNLQSNSEEFTNDLFLTILDSVAPEAGDPLYDPQSDIYSETNPSFEPNSMTFWLDLIGRLSIKDGKLKPNLKSDKMYYKSWALIIQNDLLRDFSSNIFESYRSRLFNKDGTPRMFSSGLDVSDNDFTLISTVRDIMIDKFGLPMYFLIVSGIASFRLDETVKIDYLALELKFLNEIMRKFRITPTITGSQEVETDNKDILFSILSRCLIFGFSQEIQSNSLFNDMSPDIGLLERMFVRIDIGKISIGHWRQIFSTFNNEFYSRYIEPKAVAERNTIGRENWANLLKQVASTYIESYFSEYGPYTQYSEFTPQTRQIWGKRTLQHLSTLINMYTMNPMQQRDRSYTSDIVREIRDALFEHRDAIIKLRASTGGSGRMVAYQKNPLLADGVTLVIPYSRLIAHLDEKALFTLNFQAMPGFFGDMSPSTTIDNIEGLTRLGYFLDFDTIMTDKLKNKFIEAHNILKNLLDEVRPKDGEPPLDLTVELYVQNGGGFTSSAKISSSYKSLGFTKSSFSFNPSDSEGRDQAIINILFYLFTVRDSVAIISAGDDNVINLDINAFYSDEDIRTSTYGKNTIRSNLLWFNPSETWDHLDNTVYERAASDFEEVFSLEDLSLFTSFHNMDFDNRGKEKSGIYMLWYIWQVHIKPFFENNLGIRNIQLEQLTTLDLNTKLLVSSYIRF